MRAIGTLGLAALALMMAVAPNTAHALTCGTNSVGPYPLEETDVPTNTLLWGYSADKTRLLDPSGEVVPTGERALVTGGYLATRWTIPLLVPVVELRANARYTIEIDPGDDQPVTRFEFVTADGPASAAPPVPTLASTEPHVGTYWASTTPARWTDLQFQDIQSQRLIVLGVPDADDSSAVATLEDLLIDGPPTPEAVAQAPVVQWISEYDGLAVGLTDCALWPDGAPDALTGRFATIDLTGNFSGWVDVPIQLPPAAEAQAVADEQANLNAQAAAEDARIRTENLAKLRAANDASSGCAMSATRASNTSALAALALALITWSRRGRRVRRVR